MEFGAIGRDLYGGAGASLLAYADQSVTKPVAALSKLLSHEHTKVISQAGYLEYLQEELESMIDSGGGSAKRFDELQEEIDDAEVRIGSESTLNVDEVEKLCSEILGAARRNLRGE
ncbi:Uncharacterised protein [Mycolicibacterium aichiense]|nr:Uncharacterised protein [Mycolicibacterium aichiense]